MSRRPARRGPARAAYHHGDLRRALLDAGRAALRDGGPEGCSLREVARRAGVSHAAPYHHFPSREALLRALAAEGWAGLDAAMAAAQEAAPPDPAAQLVAVGMGYFLTARRQPALFRLMSRPEFVAPPEAGPGGAAAPPGPYARLRGVLAAALGRPPVEAEAHLCWAAVHGLAVLALDGGLGVPEAALEPHARAVLGRLAGALAAGR